MLDGESVVLNGPGKSHLVSHASDQPVMKTRHYRFLGCNGTEGVTEGEPHEHKQNERWVMQDLHNFETLQVVLALREEKTQKDPEKKIQVIACGGLEMLSDLAGSAVPGLFVFSMPQIHRGPSALKPLKHLPSIGA